MECGASSDPDRCDATGQDPTELASAAIPPASHCCRGLGPGSSRPASSSPKITDEKLKYIKKLQ